MIPDIDTQLASAIKSISDNVQPAVDPENQLAQEQLYLALATLNLVRQNLPLAHSYARQDMKDHIAMAEELASAAGSSDALSTAVTNAEKLLNDPEQGSQVLLAGARSLREVIGVFLMDNAENTALDSIVIKHSKRGIDKGRSWTKGMGFEPDPKAVADLADIL